MPSSSTCRQGFPDVLDEIREYPAAHLLVHRVTVWQFCHNPFGINDALHTHEFIVERCYPTLDNVWRQLQMKEQTIDPVAISEGLVGTER